MNTNPHFTGNLQNSISTPIFDLAPCGYKGRYDKRGALTQINRFAKVRGRHGRPLRLRAYPCEECRGWHLTKVARADVEN